MLPPSVRQGGPGDPLEAGDLLSQRRRLQFRDRALALWKENGEVREVPALLQKLEKECHPEKDEPRGRFWLSVLNGLFSPPELDDEEESDSGSELALERWSAN